MSTKEQILMEALDMFSRKGYDAVSIRDIAKAVHIKESSIYYHFKNKQDILDSLIDQFETYITGLLENVNMPGPNNHDGEEETTMDYYMMDSYLFDPFCNLMLRLMMIEQFHNTELRILYERYMFTLPYEIQKNILNQFVLAGMVTEAEADWIVQEFFSFMTMLTYKYLLNGELTEERKSAYMQEMHCFYCKMGMRWSSNSNKGEHYE